MTYPLPRFTGDEPCAQVGPDWFFTSNNSATYKKLSSVRQTCAECPMQVECLDYALHVNVLGVWGGTTEVERKRLRQQLNIIPEPNYA